MWLRQLLWKGLRKAWGTVEGFEGKQTAGLNALKNRWLGRVAARVALERPAEGFEALACESCLGKACGEVLVVGAAAERLGPLKHRQAIAAGM